MIISTSRQIIDHFARRQEQLEVGIQYTGWLESMGEKIRFHTDLEVYQFAFDAAMQIYHVTKKFPKEEIYSLTNQIRQSSRSVCANLSEAWRKRRYKASFIYCLNHVEAEASETQVWLSFCKDCGYLSDHQADNLIRLYDQMLGMIVTMIKHPDKWII